MLGGWFDKVWKIGRLVVWVWAVQDINDMVAVQDINDMVAVQDINDMVAVQDINDMSRGNLSP